MVDCSSGAPAVSGTMVSKRLMRRCSHRRTDAAGVPRLPYRVPGLCPVGVIDSCGGRQHAPAMQTVHATRSEEHTSELQSLIRISYAVFCLTKKTQLTTS